MSDDIRADVAAALAGTLSGDDGASEAPVEAPPAESLGGGDETPAPVADAAGDSPAEPNPPAEDAPEKPAGEAGRARDSTGRFVQGKGDAKAPVRPAGAPAALAPKPVAPQARPPGAPPAPAAAAPPAAVKAPQSWKPAAREAWAKMPPELRAALEPEVTRREKETAQVLEQTAQARHIAAAYGQVVGPYSAMIHSEGTSPPQFIGQLLQTAQALRTAPPGHKAQLVANIVREFGVPIEALDQALAGGPQPQGQPQQAGQEFRDPRFDQFLGEVEQAKQRRALADREKANTDIQEFAKEAEFLNDVKAHMATLLNEAAQRRQSMSLQEAYERACWADPEVRVYFQQREAAKAAKASQASTQRARAASMSVRTQPATSAPPAVKTGSVEDDVKAALAGARANGNGPSTRRRPANRTQSAPQFRGA
jgi:hypothetical protein